MRKLLVVVPAVLLLFASAASSEQKVEDVPWDEAHIKQLRAMSKHAIFRFFDKQQDPENDLEWTESSISWDYAWYPAGHGKYELAVHSQSGPDIGNLTIYWQDAPGKIQSQDFGSAATASGEWYWEQNGPDLIDANGDGITEVISLAPIGDSSHWSKFVPSGVWPRVYRLKDGKFIEASRDFPAFYDKTIFPIIDKAMAKAHQDFQDEMKGILAPNINPNDWRVWAQRKLDRTLAAEVMCRDKILRVLERDPNAGLAQAREWMKSSDPVIVDDARAVFKDIGGHEADVEAASAALERASKKWGNKPWE